MATASASRTSTPLDFCVVGSVAVSRGRRPHRQGRGLRRSRDGDLPRARHSCRTRRRWSTTVHSSQLVDDDVVVIESHDSPLDMVATELELIRTGIDRDDSRWASTGTACGPTSSRPSRSSPRLRDRMLGAQGGAMKINDPGVLAEVEAVFDAYEDALLKNDNATLLAFFLDDPTTIRYGVADAQHGYSRDRAHFRARQMPFDRELDRDRDHDLRPRSSPWPRPSSCATTCPARSGGRRRSGCGRRMAGRSRRRMSA